MCKENEEFIELIDEMAGAAMSLSKGPQSYDCFMKTRTELINKIIASRVYNTKIKSAIEDLHKLI